MTGCITSGRYASSDSLLYHSTLNLFLQKLLNFRFFRRRYVAWGSLVEKKLV